MLEDKAYVQACLLKVDSGAWHELKADDLRVLLEQGLIQRFDVRPNAPLDVPGRDPEFQLTQRGRDKVWPPEK